MEMRGNQDNKQSETSSSVDTARDLMLLYSKVGESASTCSSSETTVTEQSSKTPIKEGRSFTCKTCNKVFSTFQALGGHRSSHTIKPKKISELRKCSPKSETHSCPICGAEFAMGQSLGGHMRKHRALLDTLKNQEPLEEEEDAVPVVKKSLSIKKRRIALNLDLNLTLAENYIKSRMTMSTTPSSLDSSEYQLDEA